MSCWWSLAAVGNRGWMLIERRIRVGDIWELPFGLLSSSPLASSPPVILNVTSLIITHKIFPHWYLWKGKDKTARKFTRLLNIFLYSDLKTGGKGYFYFASLLNLRVPLQCLFLLHELFLSETTQRLGTLCCAFVNVSFEKNNCCLKLTSQKWNTFRWNTIEEPEMQLQSLRGVQSRSCHTLLTARLLLLLHSF